MGGSGILCECRWLPYFAIAGGKLCASNLIESIAVIYSVTRLTGISQAMLRTEQPLSLVLPQFLDWVDTVVAEVSDATCTTHFTPSVCGNTF